ncbi:MAG: decarboxylating 6-phosphogluconate dehydrogenase [Myxococcaceae bacterium]|nr:decarboxylating 6-phosphogluconate dehydrogenase [Myxococcaceae bacterium]
MDIGMVGLGRMGGNMVRRLMAKGHRCVAHNSSERSIHELAKEGAVPALTTKALVAALPKPRLVWLMVPAAVVDTAIDGLVPLLDPGDTIVDGGNSHYQDDLVRAKRLKDKGLHYLDAGVSGGIFGKDRGYCLMIGGEAEVVKRYEPIFAALAPGKDAAPPTPGRNGGSAEQGWLHCGPAGAGHFVKMVHNAIEYGMMAAYAEGFNVLKHANAGKGSHAKDAETTPMRHPEHYQYDFDLKEISELWRRGSVVSSWLLDLSAQAFAADPALQQFAGKVSDSGEGRWTLAAANDLAVPAHVLAASLFERFSSRGEAEFGNKYLSALRFGFGGHLEKKSS